MGIRNLIMQLMDPQALCKVGEAHIEGLQHMVGFGYPPQQFNIHRS